MPGKMLDGGVDAVRLQAADKRRSQPASQFRLLPVGAGVDDDVVGIAVHIQRRGVGNVNAEGPGFLGSDPSLLVGIILGTGGADGHILQKGRALVDAHGDAPFHIGHHQQGNFRRALQALDAAGHRVGIAPVEGRSPEMILAHQRHHAAEMRISFIIKPRVIGDGHDLAHFLFHRQRGQLLFHPF